VKELKVKISDKAYQSIRTEVMMYSMISVESLPPTMLALAKMFEAWDNEEIPELQLRSEETDC
jgi:hypothetical protein